MSATRWKFLRSVGLLSRASGGFDLAYQVSLPPLRLAASIPPHFSCEAADDGSHDFAPEKNRMWEMRRV